MNKFDLALYQKILSDINKCDWRLQVIYETESGGHMTKIWCENYRLSKYYKYFKLLNSRSKNPTEIYQMLPEVPDMQKKDILIFRAQKKIASDLFKFVRDKITIRD